MHKSFIWFSLISFLSAAPLLAQSGSDRISRPPGQSAPQSSNQTRMGDISFTNNAGKTYTMNELSSRLLELRTAVDEALPLLSAFNESYSNTVANQPGGLAGVISGILSGTRKNGGSQDQSGSSGRGSSALTNIVGVLNGLFGTNTPAPGSTTGVNTNLVHDLLALEGELQPVASVLRNLNLNATGTSASRPPDEPADTTQESEQIPTPTGRR